MSSIISVPLLVANWKMNPQTCAEAKALFLSVKKLLAKKTSADIVIAAPSVFLSTLTKDAAKSNLHLAAQDVSSEKMGAFTGEISALMLKSVGVSHVIVGHSERRARGELDAFVTQKVQLGVKSDLTVVVCVGERERDAQGKYFSVVEAQVRSALQGIASSKLAQLAIAYEPVWAISTATPSAHPATPEDAHEMLLFIRKILTDMYGRSAAERVRLLYGGSVTEKNIEALVARSGAQGYLVGGASLRPEEFATIVSAVQ